MDAVTILVLAGIVACAAFIIVDRLRRPDPMGLVREAHRFCYDECRRGARHCPGGLTPEDCPLWRFVNTTLERTREPKPDSPLADAETSA